MTGKDHIRGEEIPQGYYHLVVHVWIRNRKGQYLIAQRSEDRPTFPLMWECVGGSALKGEDSLTAALRETEEEVGVKLSSENGKVLFSMVGRVVDSVRFSDIVDVWLFEYDGPVDLESATTKEVAQAIWMEKTAIKRLFDTGEFVHTLAYFFDLEKV